MKITVIGGDLRQIYAAETLVSAGHSLAAACLDESPQPLPKSILARPLATAALGADCVLLPFPVESGEGKLNAPLAAKPITLAEVFAAIPPQTPVLAGKCGPQVWALADEHRLRLFDYGEREDLQVKNAIPSAEGAIGIAMEALPRTLHGAHALVIGCGRIGKVLARMLVGLGSAVTVSARKAADLAWIVANGMDAVQTAFVDSCLGSFDVVFNTVPAMVLPGSRLTRLRPDCVVIDLASRPGGTDFAAAAELGLHAIHALGLPGKVAPKSAGIAVAETALAILAEQGLL